MEEKTIFVTETTEKQIKTKIIDEHADGNQTCSTILQNEESITLQKQ